ncbi:PA3496 family putative envelope integrity protein [Halothiobacillus sp. DCM-1]|uniref:PA3496 family putative envelope integrity protein n=1 Tax=Halothiobacillus sp. DCM-1 TaxID=3112558 RepID=UPI0032524078
MSNDPELNDLDDHWEEEDGEDTAETRNSKTKPVENKDARRRLDDLLENRRVNRQIKDDF